MANKKNPAISGRNIFKDKRNRTIMLNRKTKVGYVIPEDQFGQYQMYSNRYIIAVIVFILLTSMGWVEWYIGLGAGIIVGILLEIFYHTKFLAELIQINNFEPEEKQLSRLALTAQQSTGRIIILSILYCAFGVLFVLNAYESKLDEVLIYASYAVAALAIGYACFNLYALVYKKQHPTKADNASKSIKLRK